MSFQLPAIRKLRQDACQCLMLHSYLQNHCQYFFNLLKLNSCIGHFNFFPAFSSIPGAATMHLDGISMNIQEENSALYFRVQSEREQTLVSVLFRGPLTILILMGGIGGRGGIKMASASTPSANE